MKKKIFTLMIALMLFIPINAIKASNITIDQIIEKLQERLNTNIESDGVESTIKVTKEDNKIKVTTTTDLSSAYSGYPEGFVDDEDMSLETYILYEYDNSVISFKGEYGNNADLTDPIYASLSSLLDDMQSEQNKLITKEVTFSAYNLKGYDDDEIDTYLKSIKLLDNDGNLNITAFEKDGIKIVIEDGYASEYSIDLDTIAIPSNDNKTEEPTTEESEKTEEPKTEEPKTEETEKPDEPEIEKYVATSEDYLIEFETEQEKEYIFRILDILEITKEDLESIGVPEEVYNEEVRKLTEAIKDDGILLNLYELNVTDEDGNLKTDGPFTFKIKITPEMEKYDVLKLINIDDNYKKQDVITLKIEGDYLVGELPHLSTYALVAETNNSKNVTPISSKSDDKVTNNEKTIDNPKTGVKTYTIAGVALLLTTISLYAVYKKKNKINKI